MARENKRNREERRLAERVASLQFTEAHFVSHSGPLPAPETLIGYNQAMPGLADRIVNMSEAEAEHRRDMERQLVAARIDDAKAYRALESNGQMCGMIVALTAIVGGVIISCVGYPIQGIGLCGGTLASVVGIFVYGRERKITEKHQQATETPSAPKGTEIQKT